MDYLDINKNSLNLLINKKNKGRVVVVHKIYSKHKKYLTRTCSWILKSGSFCNLKIKGDGEFCENHKEYCPGDDKNMDERLKDGFDMLREGDDTSFEE